MTAAAHAVFDRAAERYGTDVGENSMSSNASKTTLDSPCASTVIGFHPPSNDLMTFALNDLVDLDTYPLDQPHAEAYQAVVHEGRAGLRSVGCAVITDLVRADAVTRINEEIVARKHTTHFSTEVRETLLARSCSLRSQGRSGRGPAYRLHLIHSTAPTDGLLAALLRQRQRGRLGGSRVSRVRVPVVEARSTPRGPTRY